MKEGVKKVILLIILFGIIFTGIFTLEKGSYLHTVFCCGPSYLAVTFGAYAFLKIGNKLSEIVSHDEEADFVRSDAQRAKKFYKDKGVDFESK